MTYDVAIVGGGPAGLCAAIQGTSEGLSVVLIDAAHRLGGQARESARVENYPMPMCSHAGASGEELMTGFAAQAEKFGTDIVCPARASRLTIDGTDRVITTADFNQFRARSVILSMGLEWRKLNAPGISKFMGNGVYYGVSGMPIRSFANKRIAIVGAANSAGQAVVNFMSNKASHVTVIARSELKKQMSTYLVRQIETAPNVEVIEGAEVVGVTGRRTLQYAQVEQNGKAINLQVDYLFIFIGAIPHTEWLVGTIEMDSKHFILTDVDLEDHRRLPSETNIQGVFAAGDIRRGQSVKRIIGATGDGGRAIQSVHTYLNGEA